MTSTMRPGEETQSLADEAKERAQDTAREVKGRTREQVRSQLAERSTQVGEQTSSAAQAMRRASSQLREEGNERVAGMIDAAKLSVASDRTNIRTSESFSICRKSQVFLGLTMPPRL